MRTRGRYLASRVSPAAQPPRSGPGSGGRRPERCEGVPVTATTIWRCPGYRGGGAARDRAAGGAAGADAAGEAPRRAAGPAGSSEAPRRAAGPAGSSSDRGPTCSWCACSKWRPGGYLSWDRPSIAVTSPWPASQAAGAFRWTRRLY